MSGTAGASFRGLTFITLGSLPMQIAPFDQRASMHWGFAVTSMVANGLHRLACNSDDGSALRLFGPFTNRGFDMRRQLMWAVHRGGKVVVFYHSRRTALEKCIDMLTVELQYGPSKLDVSRCIVVGSVFSPRSVTLF